MLKPEATYDDVLNGFRWEIPARFNIGVAVCDRWAAEPERSALIHQRADGRVEDYSFTRLRSLSNRLANALRAAGIGSGDRVAILLPQTPETAVAHIATYKLGAIAVPLFTLFQADALMFRLADAGAKVVITDTECIGKIEAIRPDLPDLELVVAVGIGTDGDGLLIDYERALAAASDTFSPVDTAANDPAVIIYTSGTTGPPKGTLHAQRVLLGHLPGVELPHDFFPQAGDLFWTPADWAWIGGLFDVLLPALYHGIPVLAHRAAKFDPEEAFWLMATFGVRNAFMPPTALKLMRQVPDPRARWGYHLRTLGTGGETMGSELLDWGRDSFGLTINEFYGQTECNLVVGNCASIMEVRPGSMGRAIPGHDVVIVDDAGDPLANGALGNIAVRRPDPAMFLNYWRDPVATRQKFAGDCLLTGDLGRKDDDGYFWYVGRADDVITSSGYRIGPGEVEDCLLRHPAVAMAAVVGVPDPVRTEIVKAFVVPVAPETGDDDLARDIQAFVKARLSAYAYPRQVEFVDALPMTTTGKIRRNELRARTAKPRGDPT